MTTSTLSAGERDVLDQALQEVDVRCAGGARVLAGESEHLVGHVEAVDGSGRPDTLRREEDVDAAARAEIEHGLAFVQFHQRERVAATEARGDRVTGEAGTLVGAVQALAEQRGRLLAAAADALAVAPAAAAGGEIRRRFRVALTYLFSHLGAHLAAPSSMDVDENLPLFIDGCQCVGMRYSRAWIRETQPPSSRRRSSATTTPGTRRTSTPSCRSTRPGWSSRTTRRAIGPKATRSGRTSQASSSGTRTCGSRGGGCTSATGSS